MRLFEEFKEYTEMWDTLNEWVDNNNKKITVTNRGILYSTNPELCDGCGMVVEQPYDKFDKPFELVNGHKLCSACLAEWVKLPEGFLDKVILIGTKDYNNDQLLGLTQQEVDSIIAEWQQLKKTGKLDKLSSSRVKEIEGLFAETVAQLNLNADTLENLKEWVDSQGNKVNSQSTSAAAQIPASTPAVQQPPIKVKKRKQVKNKFGILIDDWSKEFIKLGLHIWDIHRKPVDEKDSGVGPNILRIYFEMPNGEEWRLEVTTTKVDTSHGLKMIEYWDYVLSVDRNGSEVIISRGHVQDYNALLDVLLNQGVITNKSKCK